MLYCCVFFCGAAVMVIEITGSRIVAPFLGTSLAVWTSLIGVILASLSLGAWRGGILADRRPDPTILARIVLLSAWATATIGLSKLWLFDLIAVANSGHQILLLTTILLFAPSSFLLGMVSPFAVRLLLTSTGSGGQTAGTLYALSTCGSIFGTFLAGFVLLSFLGCTAIMYVTAAVLVFASLCADRSKILLQLASLLVFLLIFIFNTYLEKKHLSQGFVDRDTAYNRVLVYPSVDASTGKATREMITGPEGRQSSMYVDAPSELALQYTKYYQLAAYFNPKMKTMLVLGGGGLSFPKYALANYPDVSIDVVEIDKGIIDLAYSYFAALKDPRLNIIQEDARTFLRKTIKHYDVILCDVFNSQYSIPPHLVSVETLQALRAILTDSGLVLVNLLASQEGRASDFYAAMYSSYSKVFDSTRIFAVEKPDDSLHWQNLIFAAQKYPPEKLAEPSAAIAEMLSHEIAPPKKHLPPFTDDFAPVDRYTESISFNR